MLPQAANSCSSPTSLVEQQGTHNQRCGGLLRAGGARRPPPLLPPGGRSKKKWVRRGARAGPV